MIVTATFWCFAVLAVLTALGVFVARHPITGAVNLVGVMLSLAGIYALLAGPFLAIIQILVYAGAIMMLVVFVIMVLNSARDRSTPHSLPRSLPALVLPALVAGLVVIELRRTAAAGGLAAHPDAPYGSAEALGAALFDFSAAGHGWYVLFEAVGLVLLAALTGAVLLAKRSLSSAEPRAAGDGGDRTAGDPAAASGSGMPAPEEPTPTFGVPVDGDARTVGAHVGSAR